MVDFQTYQKTTFLINNKKKQSRAVDADHKHFLLESQLSVWVKGHFILFAPTTLQHTKSTWTISVISSGERKSIFKINNKERAE